MLSDVMTFRPTLLECLAHVLLTCFRHEKGTAIKRSQMRKDLKSPPGENAPKQSPSRAGSAGPDARQQRAEPSTGSGHSLALAPDDKRWQTFLSCRAPPCPEVTSLRPQHTSERGENSDTGQKKELFAILEPSQVSLPCPIMG